MKTLLLILLLNCQTLLAQKKISDNQHQGNQSMDRQMKTAAPLDIAVIERITGMKGMEKDGEYKLSVAQNDLHVTVDSFQITPPMGLGTWIGFSPLQDGAMIMGDIVLTETDLPLVQKEVIRQGLTITAIHNHFIRNHPNIMYMHIGGSGPTEQMAQKAKAVLDAVQQSRGHNPSASAADSVTNTISIQMLDGIMGTKGQLSKGVYKYTIGRPDVKLTEHGMPVSAFMGFNTWAAFQGTPEHAAVAGDFTMLEDEVAPVIKTLIENNIQVVAVHNHMVHERPRIFFLHYWGIGNSAQLAKGLKAALAETGKGTGY